MQLTTSGALPVGTVNVAYNAAITAAGGASPYTFALQGGSLPSGLSLASTGFISGTPKAPGTSSFGVQVTDSNGINVGGQFTITILPAPLTLSGGGGGGGTVGAPLSITFTGFGRRTALQLQHQRIDPSGHDAERRHPFRDADRGGQLQAPRGPLGYDHDHGHAAERAGGELRRLLAPLDVPERSFSSYRPDGSRV